MAHDWGTAFGISTRVVVICAVGPTVVLAIAIGHVGWLPMPIGGRCSAIVVVSCLTLSCLLLLAFLFVPSSALAVCFGVPSTAAVAYGGVHLRLIRIYICCHLLLNHHQLLMLLYNNLRLLCGSCAKTIDCFCCVCMASAEVGHGLCIGLVHLFVVCVITAFC